LKGFESAFAAAQVLAFRLPMLWAMAFSPTPSRRVEAVRMIAEKQMAVAEGLNAAALEGFRLWMRMVSGRSVSTEAAGRRIIAAAARPASRRVRANARRLKRRKRL
jgi:hypothetical protein